MAQLLADLIRAGSTAYIASLYTAGLSWSNIEARVRDRFRDAAPNTVYAAIDRGRSAYYAGNRQDDLGSGERLRAGDVPPGLKGQTGYRYTAHMQVVDPATGQTSYRTFQAHSPSALTQQQLRERLAENVQAYYAMPGSKPGYNYLPSNVVVEGFDTVAVERW